MSFPEPTTVATVDLDAEWGDVARSLADTAPAGAQGMGGPTAAPIADLSLAMASFGQRKNIRRFLVAVGAIRSDAPATPSAPETPGTRTDDVMARLIAADEPTLCRLLTAGGVIENPARIQLFASRMAEANRECDPSDPVQVDRWAAQVGTILRDGV